ncbi:MAG: FISUMP domain-containing protein, partial [Bacteroidales bacterium]
MKNITLLFTAILMSLSLLAQVPQGINYQTVIRDGAGDILPDADIHLQITIRSGAPDGAVVYQETHQATTNAFGLVNLVIGNGNVQSGIFADISWGGGDKYLETAIDLDGNGNYTVLGVTQFLSVPYAVFSQKAAAVQDGANPGEMLYWNGEDWVAIPPGEHDQTLRLCNGVPTWGICIYNLALIADPAGAGTVTGAGQYEAGQQVNITAEANEGWEFVHWTDDDGVVSEVANFTFTMPAEDVTLTANFIEDPGGFNCGDPLIDVRDGQSYATVQIGDQCWMAENLNLGERIDGSEEMADNGIIEKYCYDDDPANCETYGGLYQWNEMMQYNTAGSQGICPEGWSVPTDEEWKTLEGTVDSQYPVGDPIWDNTDFRGFDVGLNLKS